MSLDALKSAIPDYAKDLRLNLGSVIGNSELPQQQLWGTVLACAIASRSPRVLRELEEEANAKLSPEAYTAAKSAAAVMAMNNVFYRTRHLLSDPEYGNLRAGLRMNVIGNPGVEKVDFELWSLRRVRDQRVRAVSRLPRAGAPQGGCRPGDHPGSVQDRFGRPGRGRHPGRGGGPGGVAPPAFPSWPRSPSRWAGLRSSSPPPPLPVPSLGAAPPDPRYRPERPRPQTPDGRTAQPLRRLRSGGSGAAPPVTGWVGAAGAEEVP